MPGPGVDCSFSREPGAGTARARWSFPRAALAPAAVVAALAVVALAALAPPARGEEFFDARVVAVFDGDTIEVLRSAREPEASPEPVRIRLAGIDAPERGQAWSRRAHRALAARVAGKEVRINEVSTDAYGRTVGEVYADGVCVGCELVREGHAWVYRFFSDDPVLLELEAEARETRRGLWGLPEAERVPPWRWRERGTPGRAKERGGAGAAEPPASARGSAPGRSRAGEAGAPPRPAPDRTCGAKRTCREMASCAEALHHMQQCGLSHLDGDGDGVPCETLCREER